MKTVTIDEKEYKSLLKDSLKLSMLEGAGVDNWGWYGEALYPDNEKGFSELCEEIENTEY